MKALTLTYKIIKGPQIDDFKSVIHFTLEINFNLLNQLLIAIVAHYEHYDTLGHLWTEKTRLEFDWNMVGIAECYVAI